jgi:hypothetical protein
VICPLAGGEAKRLEQSATIEISPREAHQLKTSDMPASRCGLAAARNSPAQIFLEIRGKIRKTFSAASEEIPRHVEANRRKVSPALGIRPPL